MSGKTVEERIESSIRKLMSQNAKTRLKAAREIENRVREHAGEDHSIAFDGLLLALNDEDEKVQEAAARALATIGLTGCSDHMSWWRNMGLSQIPEEIIRAMEGKDPNVRISLVSLLESISSTFPECDFSEAAPIVIKMLKEKEYGKFYSAIAFVSSMANEYPEWGDLNEAVPALMELIMDGGEDNEGVEMALEEGVDLALEALGNLGEPAIPALKEILESGKPDLRCGAVKAIESITRRRLDLNFGSLVPLLVEALRDEEEPVRAYASEAIGNLAKAHPEYGLNDNITLIFASLTGKEGPFSGSFVGALLNMEPRDAGDLKMLQKVAQEYRKNAEKTDGGKPDRHLRHIQKVYAKWSEILNKRANNIVMDKEFHVPKVEKPDKTERVLRLRRVRG